jgi:hypothetical protein
VTDVLGILLLSAGVLGAAVFVGLYSLWTRWWRTEVGQWLVAFPSSLGLLLANGLVYRLAGEYPGRQLINLVLFLVCVASVWWSVRLLIRAMRRSPRE